MAPSNQFIYAIQFIQNALYVTRFACALSCRLLLRWMRAVIARRLYCFMKRCLCCPGPTAVACRSSAATPLSLRSRRHHSWVSTSSRARPPPRYSDLQVALRIVSFASQILNRLAALPSCQHCRLVKQSLLVQACLCYPSCHCRTRQEPVRL